MESQIQAQVLGVSSRQSRNGQHTMYDVQLSDGQKYTTFDPDLAQQAAQLQGQNVAANVSLEQNGRYLNRNLLAIGAPGTLPAPVPQAGAVAIPAAQPVAGSSSEALLAAPHVALVAAQAASSSAPMKSARHAEDSSDRLGT